MNDNEHKNMNKIRRNSAKKNIKNDSNRRNNHGKKDRDPNYFNHLSKQVSFRLPWKLIHKLDQIRGNNSRGLISKILITDTLNRKKFHQNRPLNPADRKIIITKLEQIMTIISKLESQISRSHLSENMNQIAHDLNASRKYNNSFDNAKLKSELQNCNFDNYKNYSKQVKKLESEMNKLWQLL